MKRNEREVGGLNEIDQISDTHKPNLERDIVSFDSWLKRLVDLTTNIKKLMNQEFEGIVSGDREIGLKQPHRIETFAANISALSAHFELFFEYDWFIAAKSRCATSIDGVAETLDRISKQVTNVMHDDSFDRDDPRFDEQITEWIDEIQSAVAKLQNEYYEID